MPPQPSLPSTQNFRTSVDAIFKNWTALQLAVSQGAAGHQSSAIAQWMVDAVLQWFSENENLEPHEVTEFLEDIVSQEFNLLVDDGSTDEIGTTICEFYKLCMFSSKSNDEILAKIHSLPKCDLSRCRVAEKDEENELCQNQNQLEQQMDSMQVQNSDSSSLLQNDTNQTPKLEADPDGWVVVERKKK